MKESLREKFKKLCKELGGHFKQERDGDVCIVEDEEALKTIERVFAGIVLRGLKPERDFFARFNTDDTSITLYLNTFYNHPSLQYYISKKENTSIPNKIEDLSNFNRLIEDLFECSLDEDGVTCMEKDYLVNSHPIDRKILEGIFKGKSSRVDFLLPKLNKKIKIIEEALDDIEKGNVWKYEKTVDVCGIPFTIHRKDDEELALGFGLGADGGIVFEDVDVPDAIMDYLRGESVAGEPYLLDEMEESCE